VQLWLTQLKTLMESSFQISSAAVTDRGLSDKRPENEDSFLDIDSCGLYTVADGVGGAQAGDVASQMAVEILGEAFVNRAEGMDAEEVMRVAIERANSAIYQMSLDLPQLSTMATTIVALHLEGNVATIGHVGDSRLYRYEAGKDVKLETDDHSVVAEEVRAGRMTAEQAQNHPSRNVISRALGAEATVEVDLKTIMFDANTSFLLCSDGVTRHVDDWEIESILASGMSPEEACEKIKALCYERGAEDNLTAVVVRASGNSVPASYGAADPEETTKAAVRSPFDEPAKPIDRAKTDPESEPSILELETPSNETQADFPQPVEKLAPTTAAKEQWIETLGDPADPIFAGSTDAGRTGLFGKIFLPLLCLILGGIIGGGAIYYWQQQNPPPRVEVPVLPEKSSNVPLTEFEESRRIVDRNPEKYISANAAEPQDAEDFYLLGRAYLLSRKYWDAKRMLTEARNRLATADDADSRTLAAEIAMALAIINNGPAQLAFEKDMDTSVTAPITDANSSVPTNVPANGVLNSNAANR
jgi:protein phosphatase